MARVPSEHSEQVSLCKHLDRARICYFAVPNGGLRDPQTARNMVAEGAKAGVPDLLIIDSPPDFPEFVGVFIEMKVRDPSKATIDHKQIKWHEKFRARGWIGAVCYGSTEAIEYLRTLGFKV